MKLVNISNKVIGVNGAYVMPDASVEITEEISKMPAINAYVRLKLARIEDSDTEKAAKEAQLRAEMEAKIRAEMEAEAKAKAAESTKEEDDEEAKAKAEAAKKAAEASKKAAKSEKK